VKGFSDCLRFETRNFGIEVVVIESGGVDSEWNGIAMDSARRFSGHTAYAPLVAGWQAAAPAGLPGHELLLPRLSHMGRHDASPLARRPGHGALTTASQAQRTTDKSRPALRNAPHTLC
jgi:hypothetical protein